MKTAASGHLLTARITSENITYWAKILQFFATKITFRQVQPVDANMRMDLLVSSSPPSSVTVSGSLSLGGAREGTVMAAITPEVLLINVAMATAAIKLAGNSREMVMEHGDIHALSLQEVLVEVVSL